MRERGPLGTLLPAPAGGLWGRDFSTGGMGNFQPALTRSNSRTPTARRRSRRTRYRGEGLCGQNSAQPNTEDVLFRSVSKMMEVSCRPEELELPARAACSARTKAR